MLISTSWERDPPDASIPQWQRCYRISHVKPVFKAVKDLVMLFWVMQLTYATVWKSTQALCWEHISKGIYLTVNSFGLYKQ